MVDVEVITLLTDEFPKRICYQCRFLYPSLIYTYFIKQQTTIKKKKNKDKKENIHEGVAGTNKKENLETLL